MGSHSLMFPGTNRLNDGEEKDGVRGLKERQSGLTSPLCLAGVSFSRNHMLSSTTAERMHVENKDAVYATYFLLLFRIILLLFLTVVFHVNISIPLIKPSIR